MILAGDMGGTKSHLALFMIEDGNLQLLIQKTYQSRDFSGAEEVVRTFLSSQRDSLAKDPLETACLGVACPIVGERCKTPNLPWVIDAAVIRKTVGLRKVLLINDLEANGLGIPILSEDEFVILQEGNPQVEGNAALISAGTGLGQAFLFRQGKVLHSVASEGGHADFAPRNELEMELLRYLLVKTPHVSYERVLSGAGLFNIYCFLRDTDRGEEPSWLKERLEQGDPGAEISRAALAEEDELCVRSLDLFVSIYGAEAGNLALKTKAVGGVYVGGGIAPKIINKLKDGTFIQAFRDKGRLAQLMESLPVKVILNPDTALYGAASRAAMD
ncbi:MAG: glucokinase [Acidobacteriota bacterium]